MASEFQPISIEHDGKLFKFYDEGESDVAVILLHGVANDKEWAVPLIHELKSMYRCIAPDLPGHNLVPMDDIYDMSGFAQYVKDLADFLDVKTFFLVGFSMGGLISLKYAERYPDDARLKGVVTWASPIMSGDKSITLQARTLIALLDRCSAVVYDIITSKPAVRALVKLSRLYLSKPVQDSLAAYPHESYKATIPMIFQDTYSIKSGKPTMCIFGTGDILVSFANYKFAKEQGCQNCLVEKVKKGGHFTPPDVLPEVHGKIRIFLTELSKSIPGFVEEPQEPEVPSPAPEVEKNVGKR